MASAPITSGQIDGEAIETGADFIFLGSKITVDGDCSHQIKKRLLLERKAMRNLGSILKSRDITSRQSEWPSSKTIQTINAGEGVEKKKLSYTVGGNANWIASGDSLKNWKKNCHMTQQFHCWAYTPRKPELKEMHVPKCSLQHCSQ